MWQSFGCFDEAGNRKVLAEVSTCLRPDGRLVLDIYDRRFFERHSGVRSIERNGRRIREGSVLSKGRLSVRLVYEDTNEVDEFDWEIFSPATFAELAEAHGLRLVRSCCGFDEEKHASGDMPRMQLILAKDGR